MPEAGDSLIRKAQQGDRNAFVALYDQCYQPIFTYIYYRVGHQQALAEDLTSEVFVRMVAKIHTFQFKGKPVLSWLYTIAGNLVRDHYRRHNKVRQQSLEETTDIEGGERPEPVAETNSRYTSLKEAIQQLTEEQQHVIIMKFIEGRSNADVALLMGKKEGAIKALQHRALASLRRFLPEDKLL